MIIFPGNAGTDGRPVMKRLLKWAAARRRRGPSLSRLGCVSVFHPAVLHDAARGRSARRWPTPRRRSTDISGSGRTRHRRARTATSSMTTGCIGCHAANGSAGPDLSTYLGGGGLKIMTPARDVREPQPDARQGNRPRPPHRRRSEARAAERHVFSGWPRRRRYSDAVAGLFRTGPKKISHAVVVCLRHLKPIHHVTPDRCAAGAITIPGAIEQDYGGKDYGTSKAERR